MTTDAEGRGYVEVDCFRTGSNMQRVAVEVSTSSRGVILAAILMVILTVELTKIQELRPQGRWQMCGIMVARVKVLSRVMPSTARCW